MSLSALPFGELLSRIASKTPAPGGGAVASAAAALSASLARMVVAYSIGKKSLAEHQPELARADAALARAGELLLTLSDEDAAAYAVMNELWRLPEGDPRRADLPAAQLAATQPPLAVIAACADLLRLFESLAPKTNRHLHSDLAIAAILAESAARASRWNVAVNAASLAEDTRAGVESQAEASLSDARARLERIERACVAMVAE
ncbi:MAG: cyclodeaminase/cyclohydrolase family protein [Phycisphaerae bacterium]|nr:cyclodeaminase/cyclohydrolase family protein [Phycisphaerae bacterium]